jgi:hypothetical protein
MQVRGVMATGTAAELILVGYFTNIFSVRPARLPTAYYGSGLRSFRQDWISVFVARRWCSGDVDLCNGGCIISKSTCERL